MFVRGQGARLWDARGKEYLDFLAGIAVCSVGHRHPRLVRAVQEQAATLMHVSNLYLTEPQALARGGWWSLSDFERVFSATRAPRRTRRPSSWARKRAKAAGGRTSPAGPGKVGIVTALELVPRAHHRDGHGDGTDQVPERVRAAAGRLLLCAVQRHRGAAGGGDGRHRGDPAGADPGGGGHRPRDAGVSAGRARPGGPARRPAGLRRGADRHGPHRAHVGVPALRGRAGRDHPRQGAGRRLPDRGVPGARGGGRNPRARRPRLDVRGQPLAAAAAHAVLDIIADEELQAQARRVGAHSRPGSTRCAGSTRTPSANRGASA